MDGKVRNLLAWRPNATDVQRYLASGTNEKLYVYDGDANHDITPVGFTTGRADALDGLGYGAGPYGEEDYGDERTPDGRVLEVATWSLDTWGEYLVACANCDGKIYEWTLNTSNDAAVVTNAPTNNRAILVSYERHLIALGAGGEARKVQWSDQEDNTDWTPSALNQSGDFTLQTDGRIVCGARVRGQHLIWTDTDVHTMTYQGPPFIFGFERVGGNCGIIAANAKCVTSDFAVWMSSNGFFVFNGYVQPLKCDVWDYIFSDLDRVQQSKIFASHNGRWGEVWFWFPSESGDGEIDKYVIWNYRENHWSVGSLARTAWEDGGVFQYPIAASTSSYLYEHENGFLDNVDPRTTDVYLQSAPIDVGDGNTVMHMTQMIADDSQGVDALQVRLKTRFTPESTEYDLGPYTLSSGYTDIRSTGRQIAFKVESISDTDWRLGRMRVEARPGGRR